MSHNHKLDRRDYYNARERDRNWLKQHQQADPASDWLRRFTIWKQDVSSHLIEEAGYNLEHAEEMLGSIDLVGMFGTSTNGDARSAEDAAHDIIWIVEGK